MAHNHGNEYQIRMVHEDGTEELSGWMQSAEQLAPLEGAVVVGGIDALAAGLYSIGIPKDSVLKYETALKTDKFLLIAHGSAADVTKAQQILHTTPVVDLGVHGDAPRALAGKM